MTEKREIKDIFSKKVKAGRRTYFFDVRETKASDYYMTLTESVRDFNEDGAPTYRKHKIYLYKEDFANFKDAFEEVSNYIIAEKGEEIISDKKFKKREEKPAEKKEESSTDFTEVNFDDLGED
ncbi:MAG: DUF3276 family protein [Flavobacteriales bacterium]|jgi:hypothetical protein|nr:DUF3276 family protein [Flavobacteriales bacterium]MBT5614931.1 DUF3276 family protein [Flavobacteriales bacterium]MBT6965212.1 DUF3276 family protein [Flavobacteriales bacterium]MDG2264409.1 DUF3276 family protein [Flavobacteriales bacterium]